jgi:hypothetical protein
VTNFNCKARVGIDDEKTNTQPATKQKDLANNNRETIQANGKGERTFGGLKGYSVGISNSTWKRPFS